MTEVRFVHSDVHLASVTIKIDGKVCVQGLDFKDVTPYHPTESKHFTVICNDEVLFDKTLTLEKGFYTAVIAPNNDLVLYKDDHTIPDEGTATVRFFHLVDKVPPVEIKYTNCCGFKTVVQKLSFLEVEKVVFPLGKFFHSFEVMIDGKVIIPPFVVPLKNRSKHSVYIMANKEIVITTHKTPDHLIKDFSLRDYMGEWNLIADFPQPYEPPGCLNQKAIYTELTDGVKVHNLCYRDDGSVIKSAYGKGKMACSKYPSALEVSFPSEGGPPPSGPNYLVHKVKYDEYSVVGSPDRASLYILSRKGRMSKKKYESLLKYAKSIGYDVSKMKVVKDALY